MLCGSNLGSLLFILYINDLCSVLNRKYHLFADELKLFVIINSITDWIKLQNNIVRSL